MLRGVRCKRNGVFPGILTLRRTGPRRGKYPAASSIRLDDDGFFCQRFRQSLLGAQSYFRSRVELKNLPPVDVLWICVAQTAGVALWIRESGIGAVTIYLSGLEPGGELGGTRDVVTANKFPVRSQVWTDIARLPHPMFFTFYMDVASLTDPVIATAAPALGNAFFASLGLGQKPDERT